jgi:hypothetical protein
MDKQTIQMILQFLERTQLTGKEVPALMQCVNALNEELKKDEKEESITEED